MRRDQRFDFGAQTEVVTANVLKKTGALFWFELDSLDVELADLPVTLRRHWSWGVSPPES